MTASGNFTAEETIPSEHLEQLLASTEKDWTEELDELVHETKGSEAAAINNSGMSAQLEYLLDNGVTTSHILNVLGLQKVDNAPTRS